MGQNNSSSITYSSATDYMLETVLYVYCLRFINTFYLAGHKKDVSRNILLLNRENNDTTSSNKELPSTQSAENCKGFPETVRQLSYIFLPPLQRGKEKPKIISFEVDLQVY